MIKKIATILMIAASTLACTRASAVNDKYEWDLVNAKPEFPTGYNYPVFIVNGKMLAVRDDAWESSDGKNWSRTGLRNIGLNSAYQKFVQFNGAIYALGTMTGNYLDFKLTSKISRTRDGRKWETVAERSNLPLRVFYSAVVFKNRIWMIGGWDGKRYYNDVWNSADGVNWTQVAKESEWSPRTSSIAVVFRDRIWLYGGGVIDGEKNANPGSISEIWSSADGFEWEQEKSDSVRQWRGTPIVFDNRLWLAGANRGGGFSSAVWVSDDGRNWEELPAPWSPRGGVAVWEFDGKLYLTGGKSSYVEKGETKFVYSNDIWTMRRKSANDID